MPQRQRVCFFTSRSPAGRTAFELARALHPDHVWEAFHVETAEERAAFAQAPPPADLAISFLNPFVLPAEFLARVALRAYNFHPATPDHPGRDPQHWAFYAGAEEAGATLHRMERAVDHGEILEVVTAPSPRGEGVMRHIERSEALATALLVKHLPTMLADHPFPPTKHAWKRGARTTRADFLRMCRIDPALPESEVRRRIAAFYNPAYRSLHIELYGARFVYAPADSEEAR